MKIGFRLPHPLTLLVSATILAALLTYVLPAGQYDRRDDPVTGRRVVIAGTYHHVSAHPLGPFETFVTIPDGIIDAAAVIAFVFLVGGAFGVVDRTGALNGGIDWLVRRLGDRGLLAIPIVCLAFATGGALENMQEEMIPLIPALLVLTRRLGFDAVTAAAMSVGAAAVGAAFSPINPFQVGIAQKVAHIQQLSGGGYRSAFLVIALTLWMAGIARHVRHTRTPMARKATDGQPRIPLGRRGGAVLMVVLVTFALFIYGVAQLQWDFSQEAALFFLMGIAAGIVGGIGLSATTEGFVEGFRAMAYAALLIGFARAITVVMERGLIIDTVVHGLATPLAGFPVAVAAIGMMVVHFAIHVPVPSVSGQAVLTLPVLVPLGDLIHLSRQVVVLAYQYGAGLSELVTPTNGAMMAVLAAAGVRYDQWIRVVGWMVLMLFGVGVVAVVIAVGIGLQ